MPRVKCDLRHHAGLGKNQYTTLHASRDDVSIKQKQQLPLPLLTFLSLKTSLLFTPSQGKLRNLARQGDKAKSLTLPSERNGAGCVFAYTYRGKGMSKQTVKNQAKSNQSCEEGKGSIKMEAL